MKQKDIVTIVIVIIVSAVISDVITSKFISTPKSRSKQVQVVNAINPSFQTPSSTYFNNNSIDATQLIQISPGTNPQVPFGTSQASH